MDRFVTSTDEYLAEWPATQLRQELLETQCDRHRYGWQLHLGPWINQHAKTGTEGQHVIHELRRTRSEDVSVTARFDLDYHRTEPSLGTWNCQRDVRAVRIPYQLLLDLGACGPEQICYERLQSSFTSTAFICLQQSQLLSKLSQVKLRTVSRKAGRRRCLTRLGPQEELQGQLQRGRIVRRASDHDHVTKSGGYRAAWWRDDQDRQMHADGDTYLDKDRRVADWGVVKQRNEPVRGLKHRAKSTTGRDVGSGQGLGTQFMQSFAQNVGIGVSGRRQEDSHALTVLRPQFAATTPDSKVSGCAPTCATRSPLIRPDDVGLQVGPGLDISDHVYRHRL